MKTTKQVFTLSVLAVALQAVYGNMALAADDETTQLTKPDSTISVGLGYLNNDRPQLGMYDGQQDEGGSLLLDADIKMRNDEMGTWNELRVRDMGLDTREVSLQHNHQGDYSISLDYSQIPRESQYTVNTSLVGAGTTTQTVTPLATQGTGVSNLHLGTERDRYTFRINKKLTDSLGVNVNYRHEEKEGTRHYSAYIGSVPNFLVEPIDSTTQQLEVTLDYVAKDLQLQGGYYGSWYDNSNPLLTANRGATTVYEALPPNNEAHQFFVNGAYTFTPTTKGTMRLAHSTAKQTDHRLLSLMPAGQIYAPFLAAGGLEAKLVTNEMQLGLSSRPISNLSITANVHYQDRDDKTPITVVSATGVESAPFSFTNLNAKLEANYRLQKGISLLGGIYQDNRERSVPYSTLNTAPAAPVYVGPDWTVSTTGANEREVPYQAKTKERTFKLQAAKILSETFNGSLALSHSNRDGSGFYWADQQNLISPIHMADRDRNKVSMKVDWAPSEAVSLQAQYERAKDDYKSNGLYGDYNDAGNVLYGTGIKDGSAQLFSVDASFKINPDWELNAWYSRDDSKATQYAYQAAFGVDPIRKVELQDTGDSIGMGLKGKVSAKLSVGADLQWTRTKAQYDQTNAKDASNMTESLPDITNKVIRLAINGEYALKKNNTLRVDVVHERWQTDDWTWLMWDNTQTNLIPLAYNSDGSSFTAKAKQTSNFVGVRYIYKF